MSFFSNIKLVSDYLSLTDSPLLDFEPTYHKIAQSFTEWPVIISDNDCYKVRLFEWGLIADYMNTPEKIKAYRNSMANARSEKILEDKRSVWYRIRKQRCLVFTTGFFEHHDAGLKKKIPYFIHVKDEPLFCLAGLYNYSPVPDPATGEMKGTFAIVTRPANTLMEKIHNAGPNCGRMPLVLTRELAMRWLNEALTDTELAEILDFEFPSSGLEAWPVNSIRTRKEDTEAVIQEMKYDNLTLL